MVARWLRTGVSIPGTDWSRARVYGCFGYLKSTSFGASYMTRPK